LQLLIRRPELADLRCRHGRPNRAGGRTQMEEGHVVPHDIQSEPEAPARARRKSNSPLALAGASGSGHGDAQASGSAEVAAVRSSCSLMSAAASGCNCGLPRASTKAQVAKRLAALAYSASQARIACCSAWLVQGKRVGGLRMS